MRILFVKHALVFPRSSGHDVHSYYLMRELARLGHEVSLATAVAPTAEAIDGLDLSAVLSLEELGRDAGGGDVTLAGLQERFRSYWGVDPVRIRGVRAAAARVSADAVVAVGLEVLPYLAGVPSGLRVWYAADEWVRHHWSQIRVGDRSTWGNAKDALIKGLYERAFAPVIDRAWVVSEDERRAMRWFAGVRGVDIIANGVDSDHFSPRAASAAGGQVSDSAIFWGRLDFGPNIQALTWFCETVWPEVRRATPSACFAIYGFRPTAAITRLAGRDGIELKADLPDLRGEIARHAVVVLPFASGGGIKNKLLEAASMGKPIVCTRKAAEGLRGNPPLVVAGDPTAWARELKSLWQDAARRQQVGDGMRTWVTTHHAWSQAARLAADALAQGRGTAAARGAPS